MPCHLTNRQETAKEGGWAALLLTADREISSIWCFSLPCTRSRSCWDVSVASEELVSTTQSMESKIEVSG